MANDQEFMSNLGAALQEQSPRSARLILYTIVLAAAWFLFWAHHATVDEVTHGLGKIIPSSKIQVVQNLEGGIVSEILVRQGDLVERDQLLVKLDNTRFESSFEESRLKMQELEIRIARLTAESGQGRFEIPDELDKARPDLAKNERELHSANMGFLENQIAMVNHQIAQKRNESLEARERIKNLAENEGLLKKQMELTRPLVERKIESQTEYLKLEREMADIRERLESARLSIPRFESSVRESQNKIEEMRISFRTRAQKERGEAMAELAQIREKQTPLKDQVVRTLVKSPIKGVIKQIFVTTIGGVVRPGMDLLEIVPVEDSLLVEAQVKPTDIAFIHPGQTAMVKVTAYDFSIYGGLQGTVSGISADTLLDEHRQTYFQVYVKTGKTFLGTPERPLKIIPGMTVTVDILTGKKTILDYLLKPILRAKQIALTER